MSEQQDGQPGDAEVHADPDRVALTNDLARRFEYHPPNTGSRRMAHEEVRRLCHNLAERLADLVPPGRERSSAFTSIESAMFWSNAGIARLYPSADDQGGPTAIRDGRREPTVGELGLTGRTQQADPAPVPNGTQNPATLVETEDMVRGQVEPQATESAPPTGREITGD